MNYQSFCLNNGLRLVHKPLETDVSYCGFIINTGTRDEISGEFGMAHFVEHMLFKGTAKRRSHHILNRMETVGGELNAYTNKEETVIYSVFLEKDFERAFELLSDITFNSVFPQKEIEKEIDVILDEINSYEDSPSELIFDEFENIVFNNSQLGHNILGDPVQLTTFNSEKAKKFISRHYTSDNIVFFSLGKTPFKKIIKIAEGILSDIHTCENAGKRILPSEVTPQFIKQDKDTAQAHVMIGCRAFDLYSPDRRVLHLLNNILGGPGMNSRLNISLREKKGYVYNIESNVTSYTDTGLFSIYFGTDKQNAEKCIKMVRSELKRLREKKLTTSQFTTAKKQLIGQIGIASDNHENVALSLGKSFLHYNHYDSIEETVKKIDAITSDKMLELSNILFREEDLFYLSYI